MYSYSFKITMLHILKDFLNNCKKQLFTITNSYATIILTVEYCTFNLISYHIYRISFRRDNLNQYL